MQREIRLGLRKDGVRQYLKWGARRSALRRFETGTATLMQECVRQDPAWGGRKLALHACCK